MSHNWARWNTTSLKVTERVKDKTGLSLEADEEWLTIVQFTPPAYDDTIEKLNVTEVKSGSDYNITYEKVAL